MLCVPAAGGWKSFLGGTDGGTAGTICTSPLVCCVGRAEVSGSFATAQTLFAGQDGADHVCLEKVCTNSEVCTGLLTSPAAAWR